MKRLNSKLCAVMVSLCMLVSLLPAGAWAADGTVATIDGEPYTTLQGAVDAAKENDVVELADHIEVAEAIRIAADKKVTICNGEDNAFTITRASGYTGLLFEVSGAMTLENVTVDGGAQNKITAVKPLAQVAGGGSLTLNAGAVLQNNNNTYGSGVDFGGAVFVAANGMLAMQDGTIQGNTAKVGGGIHSHGTVTMLGGKIADNDAFSGPGGGVCNQDGAFTADNATICDNTSVYGGGGVYSNTTTNMTGCIISGNASSLGGGVYVQRPANTSVDSVVATLDGCNIAENTATGKYGGGIWCNGTLKLNDTDVTGNTSTKQGGGVYGAGDFEINGGTISKNKSNAGGGIFIYTSGNNPGGGTLVVKGEAAITENTAVGSSGGGICAWDYEELIVEEGCTVSNNTAAKDGGGIWVDGIATIKGDVSGNTATGENNDFHSETGFDAVIGDKQYPDLASAIAEASTGDVITLQRNVFVDKGVYLVGVSGITIDGAGFSITASEEFAENDYGQINLMKLDASDQITIKNLTLVATADNKHVLDIANGSEGVVLENVTLDHTAGKPGAPMIVNGSTVTAQGKLNIITGANSWYGINVDAKNGAASVTFADNVEVTFTDNSGKDLALVKVENFENPEDAVKNPENAGLELGDNGQFAPPPEAEWGTDGTSYTNQGTLKKAFAALKDATGPTYIRLCKDVQLAEMLSVSGEFPIVLDLAGYTITAAEGSPVLVVNAGASLTLDDSSAEKTGKLTGGTGDNMNAGGVTVKDGATFTMNGGNITGNTGLNDGGVRLYKQSKFVMNGGSITNNTATTGNVHGGVYADRTSTVELSGNVVITGNKGYDVATKEMVDCDLWLDTLNGALITIGEAGLAQEAKIGVYINSSVFEWKEFTSPYAEGKASADNFIANRPSQRVTERDAADGGKQMFMTYPAAAAPTASVKSGTYFEAQRVELSTETESEYVAIYYTTDDSDPRTSETRQKYSSAITIDETTTIKAYTKGVEGAYLDSDVEEFNYTIRERSSDRPNNSSSNRNNYGGSNSNRYTFETGSADWNNPYVDVDADDWYYDAVRYAEEKGLFSGTTATTFAPDMAITRGMLVTVLYRAEGEPGVAGASAFADVAAGAYYARAVAWAQQNQIVKGYSDTEFAPDKLISREEFAAIMYRYADYQGTVSAESGDLSQFADEAQIADWARENVAWAVGSGLLSGKGNNLLDPTGSTTRAEAATILQRFLEK